MLNLAGLPANSTIFSDGSLRHRGHRRDRSTGSAKAMTVVAGLVSIRSHNGPRETVNRLDAAVTARGMTVFARIDHAAGAAAAGLPLRPTEVVIFGNARGGTPLMEAAQTTGIDLPLKTLVWQDIAGNTWVSYNDPAWVARRHGIDPATDATTAAMSAMLDAIAKAAACA
jgi:uncharacterized protein (DUF302 family)